MTLGNFIQTNLIKQNLNDIVPRFYKMRRSTLLRGATSVLRVRSCYDSLERQTLATPLFLLSLDGKLSLGMIAF